MLRGQESALRAAHDFIVAFCGQGIDERINYAESQQGAQRTDDEQGNIGQGEELQQLADHGEDTQYPADKKRDGI